MENGDAPETYWILDVDKAFCVKGVDDLGEQHVGRDVQRVQLIVSESVYERQKELLGRPVTVEGSLVASISGHHHTSVLINVKRIVSR